MSAKSNTEEKFSNLFEGTELSADVKDKAVEILESAEAKQAEKLVEQYDAKVKELEADFDAKLSEAYGAMIDTVNNTLNTVAEKFVADNEVAIETGIRVDIAENFISGLKELCVESSIEIPEGKENMVESLTTEVEEIESKLDESLKANLELTSKLNNIEASKVFDKIVEGLALTDVEKVKTLSEDVSTSDIEAYTNKLNTIKESLIGKTETPVVEEEIVEGLEVKDDNKIEESVESVPVTYANKSAQSLIPLD